VNYIVNASTLIIGIGNEFRSDDCAGVAVARVLRQMHLPGVNVIEQSGEGTVLMEAMTGADAVYLVDAVSSGARAGTVHRIHAHSEPFPRSFHCYSTHAFGVAQAVNLARTMNILPARFIFIGIEGKNFEQGEHLSSETSSAIQKVTALLSSEILSLANNNSELML